MTYLSVPLVASEPTFPAARVKEEEPAALRVRDVAIPCPTNVTYCIQKLEAGGRISQGNPEWNGGGMKPVIQKTTGMLEVDVVTALTAQIAAMQNMMNTHFTNLALGQQPAQVNVVQQPPSSCEICGGGDHSAGVKARINIDRKEIHRDTNRSPNGSSRTSNLTT
uniref:Uncharacterized protein n=1 Tax=Solanum tuberosum TaxID=4113 RepID=M1DLP3_SOLTU